MKKVFVFILLFSFSFTILCGCGPLSPAPVSTAPSEPSSTEAATAAATIFPIPTEESTAAPESPEPSLLPHITVEDEYYVEPEDYLNIKIDNSCMKFVNIPKNLREMGYSTLAYNCDPDSYRQINQYISYPVNIMNLDSGFGRSLGEVVSYDVVRNIIVDSRPIHVYYRNPSDYVNTIYNFLNNDGTFKSFDNYEEFQKYQDQNVVHDGDEYTTISKEVNGILSGGIYDCEYKKGLKYALISQSGNYAFVSQSVEYLPSPYDPNFYILQRMSGLQNFALIDMEAGQVIKQYEIDIGQRDYTLRPHFSDDEKSVIIYFERTGGGNPLHSLAIVIDLKSAIKESK